MNEPATFFSVNIPESDKPRIVIVGGGFGGINLLKGLPDDYFQVVLLDRYNYHTFQPLLYQVATAGLEPDSVAGPLRKIIKKRKDVYFRMLKVNKIHPDKKILHTSVGSLNFDYLVIATGAQINYFSNDSIAKHAFPIKQVTHALDLRSHIFQEFEKSEILTDEEEKKRLTTFIIVGGGPTGVEISGALAELKNNVLPSDYPEINFSGMEIILIEGEDRLLPAMSEKSGAKTLKYLKEMGVQVKLNCLTTEYDGQTAKLNDGSSINADTLIWAAGVKGNLINGFASSSIFKGKLMVNQFNRVYEDIDSKKEYADIFAIGDLAYMNQDGYPKGLPGLAQVAIQQGKHLAENLKKLKSGKKMKPFHYTNKGVMATIGRNKAVADLPLNIRLSGFTGWFVWMVVHLMSLVGFRSKTIVFANWVWNYITYDRGIRLILRPSTKQNDAVSREMAEEMAES